MQIVATFQYSNFLEIAIAELETRGISGIYAVPLAKRRREPRLMDSIHRADGISFLDKGFIFAFLLATVGASKGYVWAWGPVIWGLIGAVAGFGIGFAISAILYLLRRRRRAVDLKRGSTGEVVLIISCKEEQADVVEDILWDHKALGLARTK